MIEDNKYSLENMICLGKSYWQGNHEDMENKENMDQNVLKPKNADKLPAKHPALLKKVSDQPTLCSSQPDVDDFEKSLKALYSEQIAQNYAYDIMTHLKNVDPNISNFIAHHSITPSLRAKMIDWMIEVLSSYKMTEESFFRSVSFMDEYLKNESKTQETKDIHLIGVASMFSAMKYEEIHPLRL